MEWEAHNFEIVPSGFKWRLAWLCSLSTFFIIPTNMSGTPSVTRGVGEALHLDGRRVILKRFFPSQICISERIVRQVAAHTEAEAEATLKHTIELFDDRHEHLRGRLLHRFSEIRNTLVNDKDTQKATIELVDKFTDTKRAVVGALFLHEYAVEAAALFNPSIVPHPAAPIAKDGESQRVIVTLRSCGEGHISSVSFREGTITPDGRVLLDPNHHRRLSTGAVRRCLRDEWREAESPVISSATFRTITGHEFALDNGYYTIKFDEHVPIAARVVFPQTPSQSCGIEDARFVRFVEDDGTAMYYGTVTAYDGRHITPQLIETPDFRTFTLHILEGDIVNKGMALFPRKVRGKYWMLSRQDDLNILIMSSDDVFKWHNPKIIVAPEQPWEFFKMGNCGSPMETPYGWLVLTHGVGMIRRYSMGLVMLDLDDPTKVIGRLKNPIIEPNETEREGYVPNVTYTCGAMIRGDVCIVPYAVSDSSSTFASFKVSEAAAAMGLKKRE
jgi:predicted GH43/DUF377 family glycosyl hydrolase